MPKDIYLFFDRKLQEFLTVAEGDMAKAQNLWARDKLQTGNRLSECPKAVQVLLAKGSGQGGGETVAAGTYTIHEEEYDAANGTNGAAQWKTARVNVEIRLNNSEANEHTYKNEHCHTTTNFYHVSIQPEVA